MNEQTLMSFIVYGVKKSNAAELRRVFLHGLGQLLRMEEVPEILTEQIIESYTDVC